jgi:hypothetical protein
VRVYSPESQSSYISSPTDRDEATVPNEVKDTASRAELGTKWEQDRQYQPNAGTIFVRQGSIVTALQSKPLSITATCFQYHEYGRRTGLKIRSSQEGVGSSPTFGTEG